jgi:hypothetical protein
LGIIVEGMKILEAQPILNQVPNVNGVTTMEQKKVSRNLFLMPTKRTLCAQRPFSLIDQPSKPIFE